MVIRKIGGNFGGKNKTKDTTTHLKPTLTNNNSMDAASTSLRAALPNGNLRFGSASQINTKKPYVKAWRLPRCSLSRRSSKNEGGWRKRAKVKYWPQKHHDLKSSKILPDLKKMYVYTLKTEPISEHYYVGITTNLKQRLEEHNAGKCLHTSKHKPWKIKNATWFDTPEKAYAFERYLKSGSGRAFSKKHF